MARQSGMVSVVEQLIVEDSMPASGAEDSGAINQDGIVPGRDVPIDLGNVTPTADRVTIEIASTDVVLARLLERSALLEQPSQSEVGLGEFGLLVQQRPIASPALCRIFILGRTGLLELFRLGRLSGSLKGELCT